MTTTTQAQIYDPQAAAIPLHNGFDSTITDHDVVSAMKRYGGGFVASLADTFSRADSANQTIIKLAFPMYWEAYTDLSKSLLRTTTEK
jgi:hypothetical protein